MPVTARRRRDPEWLIETIHARCDDVGECWIWRQGVNSAGSPSMYWQGRSATVRRLVYVARVGRAPRNDMLVVAKCMQAHCVSPSCAAEMSRAALQRHMVKIGRLNTAAQRVAQTAANRRKPTVKATPALAAEIRARRAAGEPGYRMAADYGLSPDHINKIARGDCWSAGASAFSFRPNASGTA